MSDKQLYLQRLSCFSHILLNTTNLFKHMTGIRAAGQSWCFIWEPCSVWKWRACGCLCSTVPHIVDFLRLWHTPHYITLPLYGPQASAICRCSRGVVSKPPPILKYMQRFTVRHKAKPPSHTQKPCVSDVQGWIYAHDLVVQRTRMQVITRLPSHDQQFWLQHKTATHPGEY